MGLLRYNMHAWSIHLIWNLFWCNLSTEFTLGWNLFSCNLSTEFTFKWVCFCTACRSRRSIHGLGSNSVSRVSPVHGSVCTVCRSRTSTYVWIGVPTVCLDFSPLYGSILVQYVYKIHRCAAWMLHSMQMVIHSWLFNSMSWSFTFVWVCSCTICPKRSTRSCRSTEWARAPTPPLPLLSSCARMLSRPRSSALAPSKQTWPTHKQAHACAHVLSHSRSSAPNPPKQTWPTQKQAHACAHLLSHGQFSCGRMLSHAWSSPLTHLKQTWPTKKQQHSCARLLSRPCSSALMPSKPPWPT